MTDETIESSTDYVMVPRTKITEAIDILENSMFEFVDTGERAQAHAAQLRTLLSAAPPSPRSDELKKRPSAFRVNVNGEWRYFNDEGEASEYADNNGSDYQGLYVRDGGQS